MNVDGCVGIETIFIPTTLTVAGFPQPSLHLIWQMNNFMNDEHLMPT